MEYYTYTLIDSTTGEVFYVGKGTKTRMYQHRKDALNPDYPHRSVHCKIQSVINKGGDVKYRKVLCESEQEAFDLEVRLIAEHGRRDLGTGTLRNLTDGGEGATNPNPKSAEARAKKHRGMKRSDKARKNMSRAQLRNAEVLRQRYGKACSPETAARMSRQRKGKAWSDSARAVVRNKPTAKPVIVTNKDTGEFVGEYESIALAAKELHCDTTRVWRMCEGHVVPGGANGKTYPIRQHKGYVFRYK